MRNATASGSGIEAASSRRSQTLVRKVTDREDAEGAGDGGEAEPQHSTPVARSASRRRWYACANGALTRKSDANPKNARSRETLNDAAASTSADQEALQADVLAPAERDAEAHREERQQPEAEKFPTHGVNRLPFEDLGPRKADRFLQKSPESEPIRRGERGDE